MPPDNDDGWREKERLSQFFEAETMFGAMILLKLRIERYGVPESLYCDHKNAFVLTREASGAELLKGDNRVVKPFWAGIQEIGHRGNTGKQSPGQRLRGTQVRG
jgi:hypothetical protein